MLASTPAIAADASAQAAMPRPISLGGIIHPATDDTLAFTPDGNTVFFDRSEGKQKTIMVSHKANGRWSQPQIASFSGHWFDQDPVVAPDGSYLLFDSDRPTKPGGTPLRQHYFAGGPGPGSNIWRVDREDGRWGDPKWLGPTINNDVFIDFASIAADNTLYFIRFDAREKLMQIWRARYRDGRYMQAALVELGNPNVPTHDPAIAPDQSFIVFDYGKVKGGLGRLCIAYREGNHWSVPIDLGDVVNKEIPWGSHMSFDGREIYYTGSSGIYELSLEPWLRAHGAHEATARAR